jgi:hypothetical protein
MRHSSRLREQSRPVPAYRVDSNPSDRRKILTGDIESLKRHHSFLGFTATPVSCMGLFGVDVVQARIWDRSTERLRYSRKNTATLFLLNILLVPSPE